MELTTVWFLLIAGFWIGYFALDGFDFGVGMLLPILARDDAERRVMINTIGPVWDGNEVWVIVAGAAMFAAFPEWYAAVFSGFYLPLLLILLALIVRGLAFEYRHQRPEASWQAWWDRAIIVGSFVPALLWGVAFATILRGVPLDADHEVTGSVLDLLSPFALLGGTTMVLLCLTHGALFLALKTDGTIRVRARSLALRFGVAAVAAATAFMTWAQALRGGGVSAILFVVAGVALMLALSAAAVGREGWAFAGTFAAIATAVAGIFAALFPLLLPSTTDAANSLTVLNAAATPYTLRIMTWVGLVCTPMVIGYQAWSYWVFRRRIGTHHLPQSH